MFVATGASSSATRSIFPGRWAIIPSYQTEAHIYAKHILATKPDAKIGVLYQNDGFGKDYLTGLKDGLGADHVGDDRSRKSLTRSPSRPSIRKSSPAGLRRRHVPHRRDPETAAQAIRKAYDIGWTPVRYLAYAVAVRSRPS